MEGDFSSAFFGISDNSLSEENWHFPKYDDPNLASTICLPYHSDYINNYDSDHSQHGYANNTTTGDMSKENYPSFSPNAFMSTADKEDDSGPFSLHCRIPVPDLVPMSRYHMWLETSFMCRRNERERQRVRNVNDGFSRLRNHLPRTASMRRRQSKVETLQHAIKYIKYLQDVLDEKKESGGSGQ